MADRYEIYRRLEPDATSRSLAEGFSAAVHDPVWFLSRQWQMGEHQGENATTPVLVTYSASAAPLRPAPDDPTGGDPAVVPAEALVENEPDGWWTIGRRIRIGAALGLNPAHVDSGYLLVDPPPPYEQLAGQVDGLAAWKAPEPLGLSRDDFAAFGIPDARPFRWDPEELIYSADFRSVQPLSNCPSTAAARSTGSRPRPRPRPHRPPRPDRHRPGRAPRLTAKRFQPPCNTPARRTAAGGRSRTLPSTSPATRRTAATSPPHCLST